MIVSLAVLAVWISTWLAVGAWGIERLLRPMRMPTRFAPFLAMLATSALVVLALLGATGRADAGPEVLDAITVISFDDQLAIVSASAARWLPSWGESAILALWALSSTVALLLFVVGHRRNRRVLADLVEVRIAGTSVQVSESFGPAVLGCIRPVIVVPRWLLDRTPEERRLVVAHESQHIAARDPLVLSTAALLVAAMPWNPALWWCLDRLRRAIELDCDARVLGSGAAARTYGALLLDLTAALPNARTGAAAFAARPSQLEERLIAMSTRPVTPLRRRANLLAAAGIALFVTLSACSAGVPEAPTMAGATPTSTARPVQVATGTPYFEFQVEKPVSVVPGSASPRYPATLRSAGIEGEVVAQFVVGTDGRVELDSYRSIRASDAQFDAAVRDGLAQMRFTPAEVGGKPVRQVVQQPFLFQLAR